MAVPTWSVEQVCAGVRDVLLQSFPDEFWVRGEIQGLRKSPAGHLYFDLIEPGARGRGDDAKLSVVAFRGPLRGIEAVLRKVGGLALTDGLEIRIRGRIDYYPPQGRVQFMMNAIDPRHTLGQLAADKDTVLRELAAEGLLELNKRLDLALVPLRIGLVTSEDSAAHHDFMHELAASGFEFEVWLAHSRVQGVDADTMLAAAIATVEQNDIDVVAVVRGGGARSDLVAFDQPEVARSIAQCGVPVFVGIGHEIDRSVADEVAHTSVKTPTACAAAIVSRVASFLETLDLASSRVRLAAGRRLDAETTHLDAHRSRLGRLSDAATDAAGTSLDRASADLQRNSDRILVSAQARADRYAGSVVALSTSCSNRAQADVAAQLRRLRETTSRTITDASRAVDHAASLVRAVHPQRTLARGYSITRDDNGRVVRSTTTVTDGSALSVEIADGTIAARVDSVTAHERPPDPSAEQERE